MKRTNTLLLSSLLLFTSNIVLAQKDAPKIIQSQKEMNIKCLPTDAECYHIMSNGGEEKIGAGSAVIRIDKDASYTVEVRKDGYQPIRRIYERQKGGAAEDNIELLTRLVKINASPSDARIFVDNTEIGGSPQEILIPKGQSKTIDVKKPGFKTHTKVYYNKEGQEEPESSHLFKLEDRLISIKAVPNDASIMQDGKKVGEGNAEIIIKKDNCVNISVEHLGYTPISQTYCNKDNEKEPPMTDEITLKDRVAQFNVIPDDADIFINGKQMGKGSYAVRIPYGNCVEVLIERASYAREKYVLCNKQDQTDLESAYPIKMTADEAYTQSSEESSDKANKNFGIEVNPALTPAEAWKTLASIVYSYFDEVETIDAATAYLRTNWVASPKLNDPKKNNKGKSSDLAEIIRTKLVVTIASTSPLKYNVKIMSEISKLECNKEGKVPAVSADECFEPFPRIMRKYNDLILELQRRLSSH